VRRLADLLLLTGTNMTRRQDRRNCAILAVIVGLFLLSEIFGAWKSFWLYQDGRQLTATIISEGLKPGIFDYEYVLGGVQYTGSGQRGRGLPEQTHVGGQALVFVSSSHPSLSSAQVQRFSPMYYSVMLILLLWAEYSLLKTALGK